LAGAQLVESTCESAAAFFALPSRGECRADARESLGESREECADQFDARILTVNPETGERQELESVSGG